MQGLVTVFGGSGFRGRPRWCAPWPGAACASASRCAAPAAATAAHAGRRRPDRGGPGQHPRAGHGGPRAGRRRGLRQPGGRALRERPAEVPVRARHGRAQHRRGRAPPWASTAWSMSRPSARTPDSPSKYARTKAMGEAAVRELVPTAAIVRPSIVFGPGDGFFNLFAQLASLSPVLPLIGGGETRFQPVFVGDVGAAVAACVLDPATEGRTFELGGPATYSFKQLLELVCKETGRAPALLPLPFALAAADRHGRRRDRRPDPVPAAADQRPGRAAAHRQRRRRRARRAWPTWASSRPRWSRSCRPTSTATAAAASTPTPPPRPNDDAG